MSDRIGFFVVFIMITFGNCLPVDIAGKDIKFYKLTPNAGSGAYDFGYETKDDARRSERGYVKMDPMSNEPLLVVTGSFKHPDGNEVFYVADEDGYRIVSKEEKEQVDQIHHSNEILPTPATISTSKNEATEIPTPSTESPIIKLNIIKPDKKPRKCLTDKCNKGRDSQIFNIKPIKIG